ncbi:serine/threonine-protein kinase, partial [Glycomyces tenuis]
MEPLSDDDPERVGPYALLARLGAGGMGTVYLALAPGGRKVAVKVVKAGLAKDAEFRDRFRREVEAAREVSGAFTAAVLDAGPDAPEPWLAAAYVPGMTLKEAVEACGPLPPEALRALATGLAEALAAIHRAGLVHRDLKPANVMLTAGGPKVIDFGIVRPEDATGITQPGTAIGTPVYMSPEQAAGRRVRPSGDLFSLGVVLHYAATGRPGFDSGRPEPGTDPARAL